MVNKKMVFVFCGLWFVAYGFLHAQTLDVAIRSAASEMSERLSKGSTVAVISFQSDSVRLADYVIDELNGAIVRIGRLRPVERRQLDIIRNELNFNLSGEVSDDSAQNIGRMLGARSIITGSIEVIGSAYRIRFQVISTENAVIEYVFSENIQQDNVLVSLIGTSTLNSPINLSSAFSQEERRRASALNLFFGAGSFSVQGDTVGGTITAITQVAGIAGAVYGVVKFQATKHEYREEYQSLTKSYEAYPFFIGLGLYTVGTIYGLIRPQTYRKSGSHISMMTLDGLKIDLVSLTSNHFGLNISYKWNL